MLSGTEKSISCFVHCSHFYVHLFSIDFILLEYVLKANPYTNGKTFAISHNRNKRAIIQSIYWPVIVLKYNGEIRMIFSNQSFWALLFVAGDGLDTNKIYILEIKSICQYERGLKRVAINKPVSRNCGLLICFTFIYQCEHELRKFIL